MTAIRIITPREAERAAWRRLYDGYATFYEREMTDRVAATVWSWLQDPAHELEGVLALRDGVPVGLAHYRRMPRPLHGADIGFLDDLFVEPAARGQRIGERLIEHVADVARRRGWTTLRWLTAEDNQPARALYDRLAQKSRFILYEMSP